MVIHANAGQLLSLYAIWLWFHQSMLVIEYWCNVVLFGVRVPTLVYIIVSCERVGARMC